MKVLFINENIGGHATVHHHLRQAMAARDDVDARFFDVPPATGVVRAAGARIPGLDRLDLDLQPLRAQLARSAWLDRRLPLLVADVDVVHLYTHNAGLLSARTWRRVPTVVSLDTTNAQNLYRLPTRRPTRFTPLTVAATKPFERRVYEASSVVVANSAWAGRSLAADYGLDPERVEIQPLGITAPDFGPGPAPGVAAARPRLVFVGRSLDRKGGRQLLRVHQRCFRQRADLVLVTTETVDPAPGVEVVNDLKPGDPALWDVLRGAAAFVFPSEIDMAPNAVIEAMTAGLPVVARPVGAIGEMVADGQTGILVGPTDDELAIAIERLLSSPDLRADLGSAGRARAIAHYDAHVTTDRLLAIVTGVAEEGVGR